jgi:hypothetical protein
MDREEVMPVRLQDRADAEKLRERFNLKDED